MNNLFINLYPFVTLVSLAGYIPQIKALIKAKPGPDNIALPTWLMWALTSAISVGYGVFHLRDVLFIANNAFGFVAILAVIGLVIYNRHIRFKNRQINE